MPDVQALSLFTFSVRLTRGRDIEAAFGQLSAAPRQSNTKRVALRG
jgi:adenine C2-methylase RlmN of 23S rRNA A2503 and tRNA A37